MQVWNIANLRRRACTKKKKVSVQNVEIRNPVVTAYSFPAVGARMCCVVHAWSELYIIKTFGVQNREKINKNNSSKESLIVLLGAYYYIFAF